MPLVNLMLDVGGYRRMKINPLCNRKSNMVACILYIFFETALTVLSIILLRYYFQQYETLLLVTILSITRFLIAGTRTHWQIQSQKHSPHRSEAGKTIYKIDLVLKRLRIYYVFALGVLLLVVAICLLFYRSIPYAELSFEGFFIAFKRVIVVAGGVLQIVIPSAFVIIGSVFTLIGYNSKESTVS